MFSSVLHSVTRDTTLVTAKRSKGFVSEYLVALDSSSLPDDQ